MHIPIKNKNNSISYDEFLFFKLRNESNHFRSVNEFFAFLGRSLLPE